MLITLIYKELMHIYKMLRLHKNVKHMERLFTDDGIEQLIDKKIHADSLIGI